jgi:hypothetical protein
MLSLHLGEHAEDAAKMSCQHPVGGGEVGGNHCIDNDAVFIGQGNQ